MKPNPCPAKKAPTTTRANGGLNEAAGFQAWAWKSLSIAGLLFLVGCAAPRAPVPVPTPTPPQAPVPSPAPPPAATPQPLPTPLPPQAPSPAARPLPPPVASVPFRNWDEFRLHAGRRIVAANPDRTFTGAVPEPLLAIPVLEVELNGDGSVRRIVVQRQPSQARDTVQLAIDAVHRAAPFGDISHLPRPWKFSEVFLFRDDRRFKPRVLDL